MTVNWAEHFSSLASKTEGSALADIFKLTERPDVISFAGGFPAPDMYLIPEVQDVAKEVFSRHATKALGYGPTPGFSEFRDFIAARQTRLDMPAARQNILITSGSLQALDLLGRMFLDKGDRVLVEGPTYLGAITTLSTFDVQIETVPTDEKGLQVEWLEEHLRAWSRQDRLPRILYTIPTFQNPSGRVLDLDRRYYLLELACHYDFMIIEDNAYGELRFRGEPVPTLKSLDEEGRVIYLGTLSKVFSPGVRLGWLHAEPEVVRKGILLRQGVDQCSNSIGQLLALEFGKRGLLEKQIQHTSQMLKQKAEMTLSQLEKEFPPDSQWTRPEGGFYTWVTLPEYIDTQKALLHCVEKARVAYVPGPAFYCRNQGQNQLRLCYSEPSLDKIKEGIPRLAQALAEGGRG